MPEMLFIRLGLCFLLWVRIPFSVYFKVRFNVRTKCSEFTLGKDGPKNMVEKKIQKVSEKTPRTQTLMRTTQEKSAASFVHFPVAKIKNRFSSPFGSIFYFFLYSGFSATSAECDIHFLLSHFRAYSCCCLQCCLGAKKFACVFHDEYHAMRTIETRNYGILCVFGGLRLHDIFSLAIEYICEFVYRSPTTHQKKPKHVNRVNNCIDASNFFFFQQMTIPRSNPQGKCQRIYRVT